MIPPKNCTGCGACLNKCPQNAISMAENNEGFIFPKIDAYSCSNCSICAKVCPVLNFNDEFDNDFLAFAAFCKNEGVVKASSSGGVFYCLAAYFLANGGIVFGAAFDNSLNLKISSVENINELHKMQGSKYIQANIENTFKQAKKFLQQNKTVLFCGTPCQIAALYAFLENKEKYPNLLTVDFICHGVPSTKLFRKYIAEIEKKQKAKIKEVYFRDKKYGWRQFSITSIMEYCCSGGSFLKKYSRIHQKDLFMNLFLSDVALRECCYNCIFQKKSMQANISLADFWKINDVFPKMDKDKGVSLVLVNDEHGQNIWDNVKENLIFRQTNIPHIFHERQNSLRTAFFEEFDMLPLQILQKRYGSLGKGLRNSWLFPLYLRRILSRAKTFLKGMKNGQ
jgi:coenzyme F420-reducing hydrogenase beta subunit